MEINAIAKSYTPAQLCAGKEWVIKFYCVHPDTGKSVRFREKLNHIRDLAVRRKHARRRVNEINTLLAMGWNPNRDSSLPKVGKLLSEAMADFLRAKQREGRRIDTLRSYNSMAAILLRWVAASPVPKITVAAFTGDMARTFLNQAYTTRNLRPKSFNSNHTFYITVWNWFVAQGYVKENAFSVVKKKELDPESATKRPPVGMERVLIRNYMEERTPRFFTFCLLCFHCAIRPKEAFMLKPANFDLHNQVITIGRALAKNKRTMGVAIPDVLLPHLVALNIDRQQPDHYVFSTAFDPGPRLKDSRYSGKAWNKMRMATGLSTDVTMYQLKHAGGEQLSRDGVADVDLMNHFRHHDLSETSTYTKRVYKEGVRPVITKATRF